MYQEKTRIGHEKISNWTSNSSFTKSTPQNPMSQSVFPDYEVGRSFKLIFKITGHFGYQKFEDHPRDQSNWGTIFSPNTSKWIYPRKNPRKRKILEKSYQKSSFISKSLANGVFAPLHLNRSVQYVVVLL